MTRLTAAFGAALLFVVACDASNGGGPVTSGRSEAGSAPPGSEPAQVVRVLDGDSLLVDIGDGEAEVRLLGVNTPERDECFGEAARLSNQELLTGAAVVLTQAGADRDQFGRLLRYVFTEDGLLVNQVLIEEGVALALSGEHERIEDFKDAERRAQVNGRGIWAADACGPPDSYDLGLDVQFDAPGNDRENPNGEWVDVFNYGSEAIDLSDWTLRDESSRHRFRFPSGYVLQPGARIRIFSGCGENGADELYWCAGDAVWSNGGDTAYLQPVSGNIVARYGY